MSSGVFASATLVTALDGARPLYLAADCMSWAVSWSSAFRSYPIAFCEMTPAGSMLSERSPCVHAWNDSAVSRSEQSVLASGMFAVHRKCLSHVGSRRTSGLRFIGDCIMGLDGQGLMVVQLGSAADSYTGAP